MSEKSSNFSCFDDFVRTLINLWKFKKRVSEGEFPLRSFWGVVPSQMLLRGSSPFRSWKKCNFQIQLGAYLLPTFYWKPLFIFNKILAIFMSIPPTFLVLMPLLGIIIFWPLRKWGCLRGNFPSEAQKLKKCIFYTQLAKFGAYLLPTFYWKSIVLFQRNFGYYYVYSSHLSIFLLWYWPLSCLFQRFLF